MRHAIALWGFASLFALAPPGAYATTREVHKATDTVTNSPACSNLAESVRKRIDRIKSLQRSLQAARYAPPTALASQGNPAIADTARAITREQETMTQLNGMLANLGCTPFDIEAELNRPATPALEPLKVSPRVPDPSSVLPSIGTTSETSFGSTSGQGAR